MKPSCHSDTVLIGGLIESGGEIMFPLLVKQPSVMDRGHGANSEIDADRPSLLAANGSPLFGLPVVNRSFACNNACTSPYFLLLLNRVGIRNVIYRLTL